jgi:hypothetical protein
MRTLHQIFSDEEFEKLKIKKGTKTWHTFILELAWQ